ncbi:MAG: MFS transporter [Phyllobacteriaceae bacterium]|nr:MFS transporter [Phyllobacteriaceae bacterium]
MTSPTVPPPAPGRAAAGRATGVRRGSRDWIRINAALFLSGYAIFSQLYCVQPLLPDLARAFSVSAAESSLALSMSTGTLAVAILAAGALSRSLARKTLMFASLGFAAAFGLAAAIAPSWHLLLVLRALEGVALGGAPAVAMAYLAEEIEPAGLGAAMGLYIGGNAAGGMAGRVVTGLVAEHADWRIALAVTGALGLAAALGFATLLPPSRNFTPHPFGGLAPHLAAWRHHLRDRRLTALFATAFLAMGSFVTVYNYAGFRLTAPPFDLGQAAVGAIFLVYVAGIVASPTAGALADRFGRPRVLAGGVVLTALGLAVTLAEWIPAIVVGIALLTAGFFAVHTVAGGWVGARAKGEKAHASSLYLLAYYLGSSVMGSLGGLAWTQAGWGGVVGFVTVLLVAEAALAVVLARDAG